ncbi:MAG: hypothetical protein ACJ8AT_21625 [Hyalangium sp.]|uniref:hypothetical protein n=1 Tax=Hyalangium sp. TaxID=2028555 RepID=UPI00389AF339
MKSSEAEPTGQPQVGALSATCQMYTYEVDKTLALPLIMDMRTASATLPGAGWYTNAIIQNTESVPVHIRLTARPRGSAASSGCAETELKPHAFVVFRMDNPGSDGTIGIPAIATGNFEGSMSVEADGEVRAVVLLSNTPVGSMGRSNGIATAAYVGLKAGANAETTVALGYPIMKSGYSQRSTQLFVQNMGAVATTAGLNLYMRDGKTYYAGASIPARSSVAFQASDFVWYHDGTTHPPASCTLNEGTKCLGSVRLSSTNGNVLAAVAVEYPSTGVDPIPTVIAHNFTRIPNDPTASQRVLCPLIKNAVPTGLTGPDGQPVLSSTGIGIMSDDNNGTTDVLAELKIEGGGVYSQPFSGIPPFSNAIASPWAGTFGGFPQGAKGYAVLTSDKSFNAVVNDGPEMPSSGYQCSSSGSGFSAPLIKFEFPSPANSGAFNTEMLVHNDSGSLTTTIRAEFWCRPSDPQALYDHYTVDRVVPPHTSVTFSRATISPTELPSGKLCAAHIAPLEVDHAIQGIVTQTTRGLSIPQKDDATYELLPD